MIIEMLPMSATTAFMGKVDKYVLKLGKILHYVEISLFLFGEKKREKSLLDGILFGQYILNAAEFRVNYATCPDFQGQKYIIIPKFCLGPLKVYNGQAHTYCINRHGEIPSEYKGLICMSSYLVGQDVKC